MKLIDFHRRVRLKDLQHGKTNLDSSGETQKLC